MNLPVLVALQMESHNSSLVSDFFNKNVFKVDSYGGTYQHLTSFLLNVILCIDCVLVLHFPVAAVHPFNLCVPRLIFKGRSLAEFLS